MPASLNPEKTTTQLPISISPYPLIPLDGCRNSRAPWSTLLRTGVLNPSRVWSIRTRTWSRRCMKRPCCHDVIIWWMKAGPRWPRTRIWSDATRQRRCWLTSDSTGSPRLRSAGTRRVQQWEGDRQRCTVRRIFTIVECKRTNIAHRMSNTGHLRITRYISTKRKPRSFSRVK